jgi:hypothetical protein
MTKVMFIRTTHADGRCRSFSSGAWQFWYGHGAIVGEVLRIETSLTFTEVVTASREYALEYPESGPHLAFDEVYIAWCLIKLLEYSMVGIVAKPWPGMDLSKKLNNKGVTRNQIPVSFVILSTQQRLAQVMLPALPTTGDFIIIGRLGYEVMYREWRIPESGNAQIVIIVQPQIGEDGERPLGYLEGKPNDIQ